MLLKFKSILGPNPLLVGLGQWVSGIIICTVAWEVSRHYKSLGTLLVILSPFIFFVLFFLGLRHIQRYLPWQASLNKIDELSLNQDICYHQGGFFILDSQKKIFVCNGHEYKLEDVKLIHCRIGDLAHSLDIFMQQDQGCSEDIRKDYKLVPRPKTRLGIKSLQNLKDIKDILKNSTQAEYILTDTRT